MRNPASFSWRIPAFAAMLGAAAVAGFAPFYWYLLPLLSVAGLFALWLNAPTAAQAAAAGFAFGLGFFGVGVSWVYVSMHDFGGMAPPVAVFATTLFVLVLSLFPAAAGALQRLAVGRLVRLVLLMPALWVAQEWVRGWVLTGFPWLAMGYSQVPDGPLAGFAPVFGVYGISLAVALTAALLCLAFGAVRSRSIRAALATATALVALHAGGYVLKQRIWSVPAGEPVSVSLLQGNVSQDLKWQEASLLQTLKLYRQLTFGSRSRLIIMPETALPLFLHQVPADYLAALESHARSIGADVLVGVPERVQGEGYYNSMLSLGEAPAQVYRKHHLAPFGEYLPLRPLFGWILHAMHMPLSDFARGPAVQAPMRVAGQRVAVDICYEDVFGEEIIRSLPEATLLVNVSNDAWFGRSIAPWQHQQIAQTRALETGRYMLRATNTGVTAIIDQRGQVVRQAPQFEVAALHGQAQGYIGATPYVRWGNTPVIVYFLVALAGAFVLRVRRPGSPPAESRT